MTDEHRPIDHTDRRYHERDWKPDPRGVPCAAGDGFLRFEGASPNHGRWVHTKKAWR